MKTIINAERREDFRAKRENEDYKTFESWVEANAYFENLDPDDFQLTRISADQWCVLLASEEVVKRYKEFRTDMDEVMTKLGAIDLVFQVTKGGS